jgi:hypothetical protein
LQYNLGGEFALRLHFARLVDRGGGRAFAPVIRLSQRETNGYNSDTKRKISKYPDWTREDWDRFRWINS